MISYNSRTISDNTIMEVANYGECKGLRVLTLGTTQIKYEQVRKAVTRGWLDPRSIYYIPTA